MALAALVYAAGVRRMRRRWPVWRTTLFLAGLFAVLLALVSGIDLLATQLFSVHMVQHMLLTVVAAPLITLGAPIRPLLRGLPDVVRGRVVRPLARARWLRALVHLVRHPRGHGESVLRFLREREKEGRVPAAHWMRRLAAFPDGNGAADTLAMTRTGEELGFEASHSIEDAVVDLIKAFKDGRLPNSLDDPRYFNIKMMQKVNLQ